MQAFPSFQDEAPLWIQSRFFAVQVSSCNGLWFVSGVFDRGKEVEVMFSCSPSLTANCPHCMQTLEFLVPLERL